MSRCEKIIFIVFFEGNLPWYFDAFLQSCMQNTTINFLFLGTHFSSNLNAENISILNFQLDDFNFLASKKVKMNIKIDYGYKVCDFRPAFGEIFEDYIRGYDFWGVCDIDIILGDIRAFLTSDILQNFDYISVKPEYPSGFFSVFRNCQKVNSLYLQSQDILKVFTEKESFMFDECGGCYNEVNAGINILDVKGNVESLHHLLERNKNSIRSLFEYFSIEGLPGSIKYKNGKLSYKDKYEVLVYHLSDYKKNIFSIKKFTPHHNFFFHQYCVTKIRFKYLLYGKFSDFIIRNNFLFKQSIDIILMFFFRRKIILKNNIFSYMHENIEFHDSQYIIGAYKNKMLKSYILEVIFI